MKRRQISGLALMFMSISAIMGSGWLFSAYYTAKLAGPSASLAWIIGGVFITIIAFSFAEVCSMVPITGSSTRIPQFTHGSVVSFMFSWMIWLSYLALMATEVQAVIQYSSFYFPNLTLNTGGLTHFGYSIATLLMLIVSIINVYSLRWLVRINNVLTLFKIAIPIVIIAAVFLKFFSFHHIIHTDNSPFIPFGTHGVLNAITLGGIVFAFNGFKQAMELAGEAKKPELSVPFALVGSVLVCLLLFLFIQAAFLDSLDVQNLLHGWTNLTLTNNQSPLVSMLAQDRLNLLTPLLYFGAVIAPLAAGLMYCASAGRSLYGMSKNGYLPKFVQLITPEGNPYLAIAINFFAGYRDWETDRKSTRLNSSH